MASLMNSIKNIKNNLHNLFQKTKKKTLVNPFYEARIALARKPSKGITRILQSNVPHEYKHKNPLKKFWQTEFSNTGKRLYSWNQGDLTLENKVGLKFKNQ